MHIALIGDSTLDNKAYTAGGPSVIEHMSDRLPASDRATLLAVDGARMRDIPHQIDTLPSDATHLVLSVGGNDAMMEVDVLSQPVTTVLDALAAVHARVQGFASAYRTCLDRVYGTGLAVTVCTIYNGDFDQASGEQQAIEAALALWNDAIVQAAMGRRCPVIDLRRVCTAPEDFTRQIEPNERGGRKIAAALAECLTATDPTGSLVGPSESGSA